MPPAFGANAADAARRGKRIGLLAKTPVTPRPTQSQEATGTGQGRTPPAFINALHQSGKGPRLRRRDVVQDGPELHLKSNRGGMSRQVD